MPGVRSIRGSTAGATSTVMTPAEIKGWLDAGGLKIVGHQEISGHQAIGLRLAGGAVGCPALDRFT